MKYLAQTIVEYVAQESAGEGTFRFILPSYPPSLLLSLGSELEERFSRILGRRVSFVYGVAYRLGLEWSVSGSAKAKADFEQIRERGWYNEGNNLTSLRNQVRDPSNEDTLVSLIAGYDHIDDRASLQDFFHLDDRTIWETCLGHSFAAWVAARFRDALDPVDHAAAIDQIAAVLKAMYEHGLADLPGISHYLEALDLTGVTSGTEAYRLVLGNLAAFNLPPMLGLARRHGKTAIADYVGPAQGFSNYGVFLDAPSRKKAEKTLDGFSASDPPEPDQATLGQLRGLDDLIASLRRYIQDRSEPDRQRLLTADFTFIHDQVLGHRTRGGKPRASSPRKLRGMPPEIFLRALWLTLGEYSADAKGRFVVPEEDLRSITLHSLLFKHDFDADDDAGSGAHSDRDQASAFLRTVLGGVDQLLEQRIQLGEGGGRDAIELQSHLSPSERNTVLGYQKTHVAEPTLRFEIVLSCRDERPFRREFLWCLPQNHPCRLLVDLQNWGLEGFRQGGNALPAYAVPYLPTVFLAQDEEDVNRLVGVAVRHPSRKLVDLLTAPGVEASDPGLALLMALSAAYQAFLHGAQASGLFAALDTCHDALRQAYCAACEGFLQYGTESSLQPLLLKAFFLVDEQRARDEHWKWNPYLECAIASPLHPAVLDMMRHQHSFLCESFCVHANDALREPGGRRFTLRFWNRVTDLAQIDRPIFGTLMDSTLSLDSRVRSYGYLHLVGQCRTPPAQISSRLLLDYGDEEDEDITDAQLFQETRASALVCHTLLDYRALHAHADDGMSIGAYCGREIQPIIAGIDAFLEQILPNRAERPYGLLITIFSTGRDDSAVVRWLDAWRDRWQEAEITSTKAYYGACRISISYRVVSQEGNREQFARLLRNTALDVMMFTDFGQAGASRFEDVDPEEFPDDGFRQFPILEKACCAVKGGGKAWQRERVLSHRRFGLAALHAEVMARAVKGSMDPNKRHAVINQSDFRPWEAVIDAAHENSAWVVCLDPTIDDQLLRKTEPDGARKREIIGFGTGVGAHGESNYTVSTEQFSLADVKRQIGEQLSVRLGPWDAPERERIAESLIAEASGMAGLSVVKATGPSEYVHDYIAYATLRKLLPRDPKAFCDEIISLDAFKHWFDDGRAGTRPDLLRLRAQIVDGYLDIEAQVFECKLAQWSNQYLTEAYDQVASGLSRLVGFFKPRLEGEPMGIKDRPDQRYWWMQLHRLLASRGSTSKPHYKATLSALERLAEGLFTISWQGAVIAFWTNIDRDTWQREAEWQFQLDGDQITIPALTSGSKLVRRVCLQGDTGELLADLPAMRRTFRRAPHPATAESCDPAAQGEEAPSMRAGQQAPSAESAERGRPEGLAATKEPTRTGGHVPPSQERVPERVLLGNTLPGDRRVLWEFGHPELPNRHILVFGASGTGKTYTIQALLCELGKAQQNALIVDYTSGFTTQQLEAVMRDKLKPRQHMVRREPLPINPFRQQCDFLDDEPLDEDASITAQRVNGVFSEVYQLGDQQKAALYTAIRDGLTNEGAAFGLESLVTRLDLMRAAGGPVANSAATVISRIQPFVDMRPFGQEDPESWERLFTDTESRCHIIQLAGFSKDMSRLITEFALIDLYRYYRTRGAKDRPRVIVLDEIQNLDHSIDSPLGQLLTEGRKFGISLVLATQTLSSLDKDARDRLFQASHKLFFKPADTELKPFAQILENATGERSDEWVRRLSGLARGECYSLGPAKNDSSGALDMKKYFKIRITALPQRF